MDIVTDIIKQATLSKYKLDSKLGIKFGTRLGTNTQKILLYIDEDRYITIKELSEKVKMSTTAVENNIKKLKNLNS